VIKGSKLHVGLSMLHQPVTIKLTGGDVVMNLLTLHYGKGVLPPSAEASIGSNVRPRINPQVTETSRSF